VPADDAEALAEAIRRVLADAELRDRLRDAGLQKAARYTETAMVERYFQLYGGLT
jgi:glycosyltransferase involved in cell wall biosynthesis